MTEHTASKLERPMFSVITPTFNAAAHLEQNIKSVAEQSCSTVEHIVVDGGSSDGTIEILRRYKHHLTAWVSEPDEGIADAMNKGVSRARGRFILFLGADDYFVDPDALETASSVINGEDHIWCFPVLFKHSDGAEKVMRPRQFSWWTNIKLPFPHQGVICPAWIFRDIGQFDTRYRIQMDYDLLLRAYRAGVKAKLADHVLTVMRDTGISSRSDWKGLSERLAEEHRVHIDHTKSPLQRIGYRLFFRFYLAYRRCRHLVRARE